MTNVVTFAYFSQAMAADKRVDLLSFKFLVICRAPDDNCIYCDADWITLLK